MIDETVTPEVALTTAEHARRVARTSESGYYESGALEEAADIIEELVAYPRDEHHTMDELYEYRMLYNALLFNEWANNKKFHVRKSWRHSDGYLCFNGGWFIVTAELFTGQISNHYKAEHWDLFQVREEPVSPVYDGHTPEIAAQRMRELLELRDPQERETWVSKTDSTSKVFIREIEDNYVLFSRISEDGSLQGGGGMGLNDLKREYRRQ